MKKIDRQITSYLNYCQFVRYMSPITIKTKTYVLNRFKKYTNLQDIKKLTNKRFNYWIEQEIRDGASARSVNTYNSVVLAFTRYYIELGTKISFNFSLVKKLKENKTTRKFYTESEIEKVIKKCDLETELMIRIMFETGMRIAELTHLRLINFEGRKITYVGKGRKLREVYLKKETADKINDFVVKNDIRDYLWGGGTVNGEPPTVNTIRNRLKKVFKSAGFENFYPHALRHSFATNLQLHGASVTEIKEMIGHSNIATTERYLHGFDGKLEELFRKYQ